jgi:hypothetical protein
MKRATTFTLIACALLCTAIRVEAATVTVDPGTLTNGFMNVSNLPPGATVLPPGAGGANGPADGAGVFGSGWGVADLVSSFSGTTLTLAANQIGDPNIFWYQGPNTNNGAPGAPGNKIMDANLYNETTGTYVGTTLTFTGIVLSNQLNGAVNPYNNTTYSSVAFIKDFAADFSSFTQVTVPLTPGVFSISKLTSADPSHHIQYGFETKGSNVWAGDPLFAGGNLTAQIAPIPEPTTLALAGIAMIGCMVVRRRA